MKKYKLAIIGASGLVGQEILKILKERNLLSFFDLFLITSEKSEGQEICFNGKIYKYLSLDKKCLNMRFDIVIFSAGDDISKTYAHNFSQNGAFVIDNSNAFRREESVPLIVPEINCDLISDKTKIIANPNCSTIQLAIVLKRLLEVANIKLAVVSTYQSVSGAGKEALNDLMNDSQSYFKFKIKDNIIAQIGSIEENGFCTEENKIMFELGKILNDDFKILANAVRVPIGYCHGESVYLKFSQKIDKNSVKNALKCDFVKVFDETMLPEDCKGQDKTFVFRIRQVGDDELMFFVLADNLRRGAAFNAVLILEKVLAILKNNYKM